MSELPMTGEARQIAAQRAEMKQMIDLLKARTKEYAAFLPAHVNANRFMKSVALACAADPKLIYADRTSFFRAVGTAARLGLEIGGGATGGCYLVRFFNSKKNVDMITFMPDYRGLIDLARRSGAIATCWATTVRENDELFIEQGSEPKIVHKPALKNRGKAWLWYAVVRHRDGTTQFDWMDREEVDRIRARSKASGSGPWVTDFDEMAKKTVIRRLLKGVPMSADLATAVDHDTRAEIKAAAAEDGSDAFDAIDAEEVSSLMDAAEAPTAQIGSTTHDALPNGERESVQSKIAREGASRAVPRREPGSEG